MTQFEMDYKLEYVRLLDLLARVINANKGFSVSDISDGERLWDAHGLANKFIGHALTVLYLSYGTSVQGLPSFKQFGFIDSASIDVLTRTAMEAFLVFHYVFYAPTTAEEKDFRYWTYKAAGLAERQNFPAVTKEARQKLDNEKLLLNQLRSKLDSNEVFQTLKNKQKSRIFEGRGEWKWKPLGKGKVSWYEIAIDAEFSKVLAWHVYSHLSGYAHSSSLSVLQTAQALLNREVGFLIRGSLDTMKVVIANMIQEYSELFPRAQDVLRKSGASSFVEVWIEAGRRLDENLDIEQGND